MSSPPISRSPLSSSLRPPPFLRLLLLILMLICFPFWLWLSVEFLRILWVICLPRGARAQRWKIHIIWFLGCIPGSLSRIVGPWRERNIKSFDIIFCWRRLGLQVPWFAAVLYSVPPLSSPLLCPGVFEYQSPSRYLKLIPLFDPDARGNWLFSNIWTPTSLTWDYEPLW